MGRKIGDAITTGTNSAAGDGAAQPSPATNAAAEDYAIKDDEPAMRDERTGENDFGAGDDYGEQGENDDFDDQGNDE